MGIRRPSSMHRGKSFYLLVLSEKLRAIPASLRISRTSSTSGANGFSPSCYYAGLIAQFWGLPSPETPAQLCFTKSRESDGSGLGLFQPQIRVVSPNPIQVADFRNGHLPSKTWPHFCLFHSKWASERPRSTWAAHVTSTHSSRWIHMQPTCVITTSFAPGGQLCFFLSEVSLLLTVLSLFFSCLSIPSIRES